MTYWTDRQEFGYFVLVRAWLNMLSQSMQRDELSLVDVGCRDTPVATWGYFDKRYTVDLTFNPRLSGVTSYVGNFLKWHPPHHMTVVTCLQVLEHLTDEVLEPFVAKLHAIADFAIVSVPYEWPAGSELAHVQDPISAEKFDRMMTCPPLERAIILDGRRARMVGLWITKSSTESPR